MHPNEVLIRSRYEALEHRQWDVLEAMLAENVSWDIPGRNPLSGKYNGKAEVMSNLRKLVELTGGTATVELVDVIASDMHVVAIERGSALREDTRIETRNLTLYVIREGKIARISFFPGDQYSLDAFWQ